MLKHVWIALLLPLLSLSLPAQALNTKELSFIGDEWCPYVCKMVDKPGYLVEIVKAVYEPKGYTVKFHVSPWSYKNILDAVREGRFNGAIGVYKGDAPDFIFPSHPLGQSTVAFFVKKDNTWRYNGMKSLERVKVGIVDSYDYGSDEYLEYINMHKNTPNVQVMQGEEPIKKNIQKIYMGRLNTTAEDIAVVNHILHQLHYTEQFKQAGVLGKPVPVQVGFSPKDKNSELYARMLSDGINQLRDSGKLQKILASYNLTDWSTHNN
jgi:polar amino acid transport system substrate-binding protein